MDEVGRGTGTNDGLSIAWAVCEELLNHVTCRTLFATHYHELSLLVHPCLANRSMEVLDRGEEIVFLRKLKEGPAAESYGLHVARLAGLSERVLRRAAEIMDRIKEGEANLHKALPDSAAPARSGEPAVPDARVQRIAEDIAVLDARIQRIAEDIAALDLNRMTPMDALNRIHGWKALFDGKVPPRSGGKPSPKPTGPTLFD
jgi:DNA mismatch repair protein MutS